jgi:hypothetical protein
VAGLAFSSKFCIALWILSAFTELRGEKWCWDTGQGAKNIINLTPGGVPSLCRLGGRAGTMN